MTRRNLMITSALLEKRKGSYAAMDVIAEAKRINIPEIITKIRDAIKEGNHALACALTLDMVVCKTREIRIARGRYQQAHGELMGAGDTGGAFEVEVQWDAKLGREGEDAIKSKAERLIRDALYEMYAREDGAMGHEQWQKRAEGMREELIGGIAEKIAQTSKGSAEFIPLTVEELDLIGRIWIAGMEHASSDVKDRERIRPIQNNLAS